MNNFLTDNIFIQFGDRIFQQTVGIPIETNCSPLSVDLFLHSYKAEFVQELFRKGDQKSAQSFNYTDDVLSLNNTNFSNFLHLTYQVELVVKDTTDSPNSSSYLDLQDDINGTLTTKCDDKRDDFNIPIVIYPFLDSNIPSSPAYCVYMSQLIRYSRNCNSYQDVLHRLVLLTRKLFSESFIETRLRLTLKTFFGRYHHLSLSYRVSVTIMANDICRP